MQRWMNGVPEAKKATLIPADWFDAWANATWATDPVGAKANPPGFDEQLLGLYDTDPAAAIADYMGTFQLTAEESLAGVLVDYEAAAAETDRSTRAAADLDRKVPLPASPWGPDPDGCTVRWVLLHLIEETARHAGHADLLREALDGGLSGPLMAAAEGWPADGWVTPWQPPS